MLAASGGKNLEECQNIILHEQHHIAEEDCDQRVSGSNKPEQWQVESLEHGAWHLAAVVILGWGLLSQYLSFRYFSSFSELLKYWLAMEYHVHIWQMSLHLSCGDICQIWMWFEESTSTFASSPPPPGHMSSLKSEQVPNNEMNLIIRF